MIARFTCWLRGHSTTIAPIGAFVWVWCVRCGHVIDAHPAHDQARIDYGVRRDVP